MLKYPLLSPRGSPSSDTLPSPALRDGIGFSNDPRGGETDPPATKPPPLYEGTGGLINPLTRVPVLQTGRWWDRGRVSISVGKGEGAVVTTS